MIRLSERSRFPAIARHVLRWLVVPLLGFACASPAEEVRRISEEEYCRIADEESRQAALLPSEEEMQPGKEAPEIGEISWVELYRIEDGKRELAWSWLDGWAEFAGGASAECFPDSPHVFFDHAEIGGMRFVLKTFDRQIVLSFEEKTADGGWRWLGSRMLGMVCASDFAGRIALDGRIEADGDDGVKVELRRWVLKGGCWRAGEPEVHRFSKADMQAIRADWSDVPANCPDGDW